MSVPVSGEGGSGSVTVYTLAQGEQAMLQALSFTVDTDGTAGTHAVRVKLELPTVGVVARLDDLNIGGPGQTNFYTYGLGLNASACTVPSGIAVTDALPWTDLEPGATITVETIDGAGSVIAGDAVSAVLMMFDRAPASQQAPALQEISLLPGSLAA